jgi:transcriptional regulator with XRE-family HTH domain
MTTTNFTWDSRSPIDTQVVAETALAIAQSTICNAMMEAELTNSGLARKMGISRSFVSRMLNGSHNLTVKTFAKALAACGFEIAFERRPLKSRWISEAATQLEVRVTDDVAPADAAGAYDLAA